MESNEPVEAPQASTDELSAQVAAQFVAQFANGAMSFELAAKTGIADALAGAQSGNIFDLVRGRHRDSEAAQNLKAYLAEAYPGCNLMIVRTRFYLEYWARQGRGWQVADSVLLMADRSDKRMLMDVRVHASDDHAELWRGLAQERVTPRASEKGIRRAIASIIENYALAGQPAEVQDE